MNYEATLKAILEREKKASKGPWTLWVNKEGWHPEVTKIIGPKYTGSDIGGMCVEDGEFIVHAREDIPTLLLILDEKEKEIERLKAVLKR
jgi:hypothetical protein